MTGVGWGPCTPHAVSSEPVSSDHIPRGSSRGCAVSASPLFCAGLWTLGSSDGPALGPGPYMVPWAQTPSHVSGTEQNSQAEPTGPMPAKSQLGEGGSLADAARALALLWAMDLWGLQRILERAPRERCTAHTCCHWAPIPAPRPRFPAEPQFPPL